jgi:IclR family transcriptional regulator, mhp operon transcriptional activator
LSRGIAVLRAMNLMPGGIGGISDISRAIGVHRTTVKRILETLRIEGLVHRKDEDGLYALTFEVRRLSDGYIASDWIDRAAEPAMLERLHRLAWPSDMATPEAGFMIVRASTQRGSLLSQHRSMIGVKIPMLVSSVGRAWLAWCTEEERDGTLALLRARDDEIGEMARDRPRLRRIIKACQTRGYAMQNGEWLSQSAFAAIAFPIFDRNHAIAAINIVFPRNAISARELEARFVPELRSLADEISARTRELRKPLSA